MDDGLARAMSVMSSQRATSGCGWSLRLNNYEQRPREVPFSFATFLLGKQIFQRSIEATIAEKILR